MPASSPEIFLISEKQLALKDLKGISKQAASPQKGSVISQQYLNQLAQEELDHDLEQTFAALRSKFKFKRKELTAEAPSDGIGAINTKAFVYEVSVLPIEDVSRKVMIRRCIRQISQPDAIVSEAFHEVFGTDFNQLQVQSESTLDLESIIDAIEDADSDDIEIDYDKDITWCRIGLRSGRTTILAEQDQIRVSGPADVTPDELIDSFVEMQNCFMESLGLTEPLLKSQI